MARALYPAELYSSSDKSSGNWTPPESVNLEKKPLTLKLAKHLKIFTATFILAQIHRFYRKWAYFVDRFSIPIILISLILTGIGTFKILRTPRKNDITNYTPYGVRSRTELAIRQEFFNENGAYIYFVLLAKPLHDKNMINAEYLRELVEIDDLIRNNFTIRNHYTGGFQSYSQFCRRLCDINEPLRMFYFGLSLQQEHKDAGEPYDESIKLDYPITEILGRKINIQLNFFGITFQNETENGTFTNIKAAETASLFYQAERVGGWTDEEVKEYEMGMNNFFRNNYTSKNLKIMTASRKFVETEFIRSGMKLVPLLGIGFVIMSIVASLTVLLSAFYMKQASFNKIVLALAASICPFMASGTAIGILLFLGVRFGSILLLSPFLLLVIGLDDSYLMIHSWQRIIEKRRQEEPRVGDSAAERMAEVLIETGPSILISTLTNVLADAVGAFTGSPEITLLCMGTMLSVAIDFFYQITVFSAVMIILGKKEMEQEKSRRNTPEHSIGESSQEDTKSIHKRLSKHFNKFVSGYVKFITNWLVSTIVVGIWVAFIVFSAFMASKLQVNLTTEKLYAEDSPLLEIDTYKENVMLPTFENAYIFVNNPGNLSDPARRDHLNHFVKDLESLPESWGSNTTRYFIPDFLAYEKEAQEIEMNSKQAQQFEADMTGNNLTSNSSALAIIKQEDVKLDENDLLDFIDWPEYNQWKAFLKMDTKNNETHLDKFFFTTAYHGQHLKIWYQKAQLLKRIRRIVDKYAEEFNASIYFDQGIFLDLVDNLPTDLWQSLLGTVCCMAAVCFIFMNNFLTAFVATGTIASIVIGVLGILSLNGVTMDPIMMTGVIISVGFSVDIPAHISYHFHTAGKHSSEKLNVEEKIKHSLASVGYPAIQGAVSTAFCVISLLTIKLYLANMFFKCISLTLLLCVIHSLVILPAIFSFFDRLLVLLRIRKKSSYHVQNASRVNAG